MDDKGKEFRTCVDCQKQFYITESEKQFYAENKYELPKRCYNCRKKKREAKEKIGLTNGR